MADGSPPPADINDQVDLLLAQASTRTNQQVPSELDLVEMPVEGVAAYWLSLRKIMGPKWNPKLLRDETGRTIEPFIRHLLDLGVSSWPGADVRRLAGIKGSVMIRDLQRKFVLMAIAVLGIASNENPQKVMVRIVSKFPISPIFERQVFDAAQLILKNLGNTSFHRERYLRVDHRIKAEALIITLIMYCMLVRRSGPEALEPARAHVHSAYFLEGLNLIRDGFEADFIKHRLNLQKREILQDTEMKMEMSLEMCLALRADASYEDMHRLARSYFL
ncbi:MAG: hypothetical protein EOM25_03870 [Deltaproteobacteria bacterium]|nr:hypothetical protein [Deltaproteobacteria bacterium]